MIGSGAKILGPVEIGKGAKIGAGSVVLDDVAPHKTGRWSSRRLSLEPAPLKTLLKRWIRAFHAQESRLVILGACQVIRLSLDY
jgi:carbonic anhydrase/acetyltransferase-like protein (isoleucine patch superfamily)